MSLADRVAEIRAASDTRIQPPSPAPLEAITTRQVDQNRPSPVLLPWLHADRIMQHFGVESMLLQVSRYWGEGSIYKPWCGIQLQGKEHIETFEVFKEMKLHLGSQGYWRDHPQGSTHGMGTWIRGSGGSYWERVTSSGFTRRQEIILVQAGQLSRNNPEFDGLPHGFALAIAINVAPNGVNGLQAFEDEMEVNRRWEQQKPMIDDIAGIESAALRFRERRPQIPILKKPTTPWAVFTRYSDVEVFEKFLAKYIVDSGFEDPQPKGREYWANLGR